MTEIYDLIDLFYSSRSAEAKSYPTVLVVDDNPEALKIARRALGGLGAEVVTFGSVEEAREYLRYEIPDIVVTDLIFPAASGFSLLEELRTSARLRHVPRLVMSGWRNEKLIQKAQQYGVAEFLVKPFAPQVLRAKVAERL